jgi:hypothetical protein
MPTVYNPTMIAAEAATDKINAFTAHGIGCAACKTLLLLRRA